MATSTNIGTELAGYRLEALIGRGGMGVVYRARDLALDRDVALKLLAPRLADDSSFRERFLTESRVAASLEHPNVIPIHDAGEIDGQLYIAMRLVDGTDLKALLRDGPLEPPRAVRVLEQVAAALDAAHARGLVHRDVKPSNVLLDEREHVYLADFGLSRYLGDAAAQLGPAKSLGTADYVAPEQIRGEQVDGRADVYALGCMLYECLAGEPPFSRPREEHVLYAHIQGTLKAESQHRIARNSHRTAAHFRAADGPDDSADNIVIPLRFDTVWLSSDRIAITFYCYRIQVDNKIIVPGHSDNELNA